MLLSLYKDNDLAAATDSSYRSERKGNLKQEVVWNLGRTLLSNVYSQEKSASKDIVRLIIPCLLDCSQQPQDIYLSKSRLQNTIVQLSEHRAARQN